MQYPAVLITTGLNDPRVSPREPGKLAATLQASGTAKPILLRIDAEAGHGIGSTKTQNDQLFAESLSARGRRDESQRPLFPAAIPN